MGRLHVFHEARGAVSRGLVPDGVLYFVFTFVPGATLNKHIVKEHGFTEERVRFYAAEVERVLLTCPNGVRLQIIQILGALHERGFVYRDLKASNIVLEPNGRLTLLDFGFAKYIGARYGPSEESGRGDARNGKILGDEHDRSVELSTRCRQKSSRGTERILSNPAT